MSKKTKPIDIKTAKGIVRIDIAFVIPRPENPEICDQGRVDPIFLDVLDKDKTDELEPGMIKQLRSVLAEVVKSIREYKHAPIQAPKNIELPEKQKIITEPSIEVYAVSDSTKQAILVDNISLAEEAK